ncbi:MAG: AraC family transcriptional regulator [Bacillota bacterium]|nr:AraC family transcriptional regulator [Bacillota bacterium]
MENISEFISPEIKLDSISVSPKNIQFYIPPMTWKGDPVGHVGMNDVFFFVVSGECYLTIEDKYYIVKPGQLAFLPKGKRRAYTHMSNYFAMYEIWFSVEANGNDLFELLGLTDGNYVVDTESPNIVSQFFEKSMHYEYYKSVTYDIIWCANILNIVKIYIEQRSKMSKSDELFSPILKYMSENIAGNVNINDLASLVYMQPTYFIKKFKEAFGLSPLKYFGRLKVYRAMHLLCSTSLPIEQISKDLGIKDTAYFSRFFKKHSSITPTEYRIIFSKNKS